MGIGTVAVPDGQSGSGRSVRILIIDRLSHITAVTAIPAADWFAVARWAKETHNLQR